MKFVVIGSKWRFSPSSSDSKQRRENILEELYARFEADAENATAAIEKVDTDLRAHGRFINKAEAKLV